MGKVKNITSQSQLIEAIKRNDEQVLKNLYLENFRKIEIYVLKNNGSIPQAKDLYQEAFITVWKNIRADKFVPQNNTALQGYLYQIARHKWTDYLRSSRYKKTGPLHREMNPVDDSEMEPVSERAAEEDKINNALAAFENMGKECKELLKQYYFQKKSLREIASELKIEEASARNKKYRCIQKLKAMVSDSDKENSER